MKPKKTKKANLENFRTIFFQAGTIIVLSAILLAFEWKSSDVKLKEINKSSDVWDDSEEIPPITMPKQEVQEVKPPSFEIEIIEDDGIEDEIDLLKWDTEADEYTAIDIQEFDDDDSEDISDEPFLVVEFMPTFQGKDLNHFSNYVKKNVKFPREAQEFGIAGKVYAKFVVNKDGYVTDIEILRGVHPIIDKAVEEVIGKSPQWEPGMNNGRYVKVQFTIAIAFKLI